MTVASDTIDSVLEHAPHVRCFAIGSDEVARRNSERAAQHRPRMKRRQAARNQYAKWKRSVDAILSKAKAVPYEDLIRQLQELPLDAVTLAFDAESADAEIDRVASEIKQRPAMIVGIWEQFITEELVVIWLWQDR